MTRFQEGRRIEASIAHTNKAELEWAESYCRSRLSRASTKHGRKRWESLLRRIEEAKRG